VSRLVGGLLAIGAGLALAVTELMFAPALVKRMNADPALLETYGAGMMWVALISLGLIGGGIAAIFLKSRNSN